MTINPNYCTELSHLIRQRALTPLFQPIFNLSSTEVLGYEALIRGPSDSPLHSPLLLFKAALMCGMLEPLEMLCRQISIEAFARAKMPGLLFLNVNPLLLLTSDHPSGLTNRLLQQVELDPSRVVIEISEQYQVEDPSVLVKAVNHYRELGFSIAIDDLGSGFSGLKLWSELKPDIVKIDRYFISQLHTDPTKRAFVQNIVALANATGSKIVAEGIETQEELLLCQELGADYGQGFLLGRPTAKIEALPPGRYLLVKQKQPYTAAAEKVSAIVQFLPAVESGMLAGEVMQLFSNSPDWAGLAVVESDIPVGMINRAQLLAMFAMPYGRALYEKKPIKRLMAYQPGRCQSVGNK
jgi:EAL domain-containing protein (putative c-di-GMP-specific phosphodiesterase class I)